MTISGLGLLEVALDEDDSGRGREEAKEVSLSPEKPLPATDEAVEEVDKGETDIIISSLGLLRKESSFLLFKGVSRRARAQVGSLLQWVPDGRLFPRKRLGRFFFPQVPWSEDRSGTREERAQGLASAADVLLD